MSPHASLTVLVCVYLLVLCHHGSFAGDHHSEYRSGLAKVIPGPKRIVALNKKTQDGAVDADRAGITHREQGRYDLLKKNTRIWAKGHPVLLSNQQRVDYSSKNDVSSQSGSYFGLDVDGRTPVSPQDVQSSHRARRTSTKDGSVGPSGPKRGPSQTQQALLLFLNLVKNNGLHGSASKLCQEGSVAAMAASDIGLNLTSDFYSSFSSNSTAAVYTANLLSSIYSRLRSNSSVFYNANYLFASVRNNVENYPSVSGSCVAFDGYKFSDNTQLYSPCVQVDDTGALVEHDLGKIYDYTAPSSAHYTEWFTRFKSPLVQPPEIRWGSLIPRLNATTNGSPTNTSYAFVGENDGSWGPPYLDCNRTDRWLVTYSVPFFDHNLSFMGVATVDVDVRSIDINQCDDGDGVYAGTHRCSNTTKCVHIPGMGFQSGTYMCVCRDSFYFPDKSQSRDHFQGTDVEREYHLMQMGQPNMYEEGFACLPCREGCETCMDDSPCFLENDILLRILILSVQGICIFLTGVLAAVVFKYKNLKVINCDSPWMLVVVLLGAFLLYSELAAMFFHPSILVCFMQRWLRGWGFAIAYGMLVR